MVGQGFVLFLSVFHEFGRLSVMSKTYKIFAYGSLINHASLTRTVPEARNIIPAKTFGLKRVFNLASTYRYDPVHRAPICVLNAEPAKPDIKMNGTCFEMDESSLQNLLEREKGYHFRPIEASHYHDEHDRFTAYYFTAKAFQPYRFLASSTEQRHYLNLCLSGSAVFGQQFIEDFKRSTTFWGVEHKEDRLAIWRGEF
ncbi:MAG: gamma-glutamylcyclotransferase family protein [Gammaproteobacteria bacterium]